MSELCLKCYNELSETALTEKQVILSATQDVERCGNCGAIGRVLVRIPPATPLGWCQCRFWEIMDKLGM